MSTIDLHLVSWNRAAMTKLVIKTIRRNTKPGTYRLTVWDNGSDKVVQNMLHELDYMGLIDNLVCSDKNLGLETARQQLLRHHTFGEFFVDIDNDCLPPPMVGTQDWLERMLYLMDKYKDFAAIAQRTQVMIGTGNIFESADEQGYDIVPFPHPGGSFRIMRTEAVNQVNGWSEGKPGRGAEERYIGAKLHEAGWETGFAAQIHCLHLFGLRNVLINGRRKNTDRWGYNEKLKPEDTGHSDIDHPALRNGDDPNEIEKYSGRGLTYDYIS